LRRLPWPVLGFALPPLTHPGAGTDFLPPSNLPNITSVSMTKMISTIVEKDIFKTADI
jgi:hypothetical protein